MRLYAGIDAGQTATVATVANEVGVIVGRGSAGPADDVGAAARDDRFARQVEAALARARAAVGGGGDLVAAAIALSGYDGTIRGRSPAIDGALVRIEHDAVAAHAGAFVGAPGIVAIAGTGSVAYGCDPLGTQATAGGWGYLFGDEGSAFALARDTIAEAMRAWDASGEPTPLGEAALSYFGVSSLGGLARAVYREQIDRPALAGFARIVADAARVGNAQARAAIDRAGEALATIVAQAARTLRFPESIPVAFVGGATGAPGLVDAASAALAGRLPAAVVVPPRYPPDLGALVRAFDLAGVTVPALEAPV